MKKYLDNTLSAEERAKALVDEMTIEEMASQLRYDAPAIERLGVPSYNWWNEGLHGLARSGVATVFPQAIGLAAMFDDETLYKVADVISTETRAKYNAYQKFGDHDIYKGLTLWSPNINIFRDPRWGRGHETYGEDPFLTAKLGTAFVKGLQGNGKYLKTAACAKHFAVHSGPESLRHEFDATVSEKEIEETYLPAFETLVKDADVEGVMGAYNRVNGEPSCASRYLYDKLCEWNFDGYFVSDCWAIQDFHLHHKVTDNSLESAALAIKTGCDVNCGCTYVNILAALNEGLITEDDIKKACVHLMRTRIRLGMFDETEFDSIPYEKVSCKEHKKLSLECARKSLVLLKNNGILPLDKNKYKTIGVIGPTADSRIVLEGNYNGLADKYTTILEGITNEFDGRVLFAEGCHLYKDRVSGLAMEGDRYAEAMAVCDNSDLIVLCVGLDSTIEGEEGDTGNEFSSGDKNDLLLPPPQRKLIEKVMSFSKPVVIVLTAGSSINVNADSDALLCAWYPGAEGGKAIADVLFGKESPSGKLPVTFYENTELLPSFTDYSMKNRTYRFAENNVLYPFGYGLTYSSVSCNALSYDNKNAVVTVKNNGNTSTDEVIQLYIKDYSEYAVTNHSLCGFKRINLKAGEEKEIIIPVPEKSFTSVDGNGKRAVYSDRFTLYAGVCQPDSLSEKLTGTKCVSVEINR